MYLQSLEGELTNQQPLLNKLKDLGKKVGDNTKDLSTKAELKNKITAIEKPVMEMEAHLGMVLVKNALVYLKFSEKMPVHFQFY